MGKTKERGRYQSISLSVDFVDEITEFVKNSNRYKSVADFTREALREKIDREKNPRSHVLDEKEIIAITSKYLLDNYNLEKK